jgi:hypothetical protein
MKKLICLLTAILLVAALACPVFAAEGFVPSISDKEEPDIVPDDEGVLGAIYSEDGQLIGQLDKSCLVITSISKALTSTDIPDAARQLLLWVYDQLLNGSMTLPYHLDGLKSEDMVIRDLIDASWTCTEHPDMLEPEGVTIDLTFDLGVDPDIQVYVYAYKNDQWVKTESVRNNGDGTVTVTFEHLCPIAFSVSADANKPPVQTGDAFQMNVWFSVMAISAAALCAALVLRRRAV